MVGVPGKSKGCHACRERKIKCGQERPQCLRCTRSNRFCPGYDRKTVFVPVNFAERKDKSPREGLSLVQSAYHQHLMDDFYTRCVPDIGSLSKGRSWLNQILQISIKTRALKASSLALGTALLAHTSDNQALLHESWNMYTRGLHELQAAILNPSLARHDETLAACLALAMYEVTECPAMNAGAYYQHCRGLLSLVRVRGIDAHTSGLGHQLFLAVRLHGILYDLAQVNPSFMAHKDWIEGPWQHSTKQPMDCIFDCISHIPRLFRQLRIYSSLSSADQKPLSLELMAEFQFLDSALQDIYKDLQASCSGPLYWYSFSREYDPANLIKGPLFPIAFQFPDLETAGNLMILWATRALLWTGRNVLSDHLKRDPHSEIVFPSGDVASMATNVCQSAEFCLNERNSVIGAYMVSMPLAICKSLIQSHASYRQQVAWMQFTLEALQNRGLQILKYQ